MGTVLFILTSVCFLRSEAFLLHDKSAAVTTPIPGISDQQYVALLNLIMSEQSARLQLEKRVTTLEGELLSTQQGLTDMYDDNQRYNKTITDQNKMIGALQTENTYIKTKYTSLKYDFDNLSNNNSNLEYKLSKLQRDFTNLEGLKGVSNLQTIMDLQTNLTMTNNKVNSMSVDIEARKQDFIALYNSFISNENKLQQVELHLNQTNSNLVSKIEKDVSVLSSNQNASVSELKNKITSNENKINLVEVHLNHTTQNIVSKIAKDVSTLNRNQNATYAELRNQMTVLGLTQNLTSNRLDEELHNMSGRVSMTACAYGGSSSSSEKVRFTGIHTRYGVSDTVMSDLGSAGNFRVEKSGVYQISVYISTNTRDYDYFYLFKNNNIIGRGFMDTPSHAQTSTVVVTEHLSRNDIIYIKTSNNLYVYYTYNSCLTLLQLTTDK